jgi:hypothetical protein
MKNFGTKFSTFALVAATTLAISACGAIPECNEELDECTYGGPYTEERTVEAGKRAPAPVVVEETVVVVEEPAPMPEPVPAPAPVVDDTPVMTSAEPQFTQISK